MLLSMLKMSGPSMRIVRVFVMATSCCIDGLTHGTCMRRLTAPSPPTTPTVTLGTPSVGTRL